MRRTRWRKRGAALVMALTMVLSSFSGVPVYADGETESTEETQICGFYTSPDMDSTHYIESGVDNKKTYGNDGYTGYFVYQNQAGSASEIYLNTDGNNDYEYKINLGVSDKSGITFEKVTTAGTDYTACRLTIPAGMDIGNALVYFKHTDGTEDGIWLYLNWIKSGLVQCYGGDWDNYTLPNSVTQENISKSAIEIPAYSDKESFFGYVTLDSNNNMKYTPVSSGKLSIEKQESDGKWTAADGNDGTIELIEEGSETGAYRYSFYKMGTYSIAYTDGDTTDRMIVNVTNIDSGYVTDLSDFVGSYIGKDVYGTQKFAYQTEDTFYFVFDTCDGTRKMDTDESGNVITYRNNDENENVQVTLEGVTITKNADVGKYAVYKITLDDTYKFDEGGFCLHTFVEGEETEPSGAWIDITQGSSGLEMVIPDWDNNVTFNENGGWYKSKDFEVKSSDTMYFVNVGADGTVTRCNSDLKIRNQAGEIVDSSVATIKKNTDYQDDVDRTGLYDVRFAKSGTYRIEDTDGSYVIARVKLPVAGFYTSSTDISDATLVGDDVYTYSDGKSDLYMALSNNTDGYTLTFNEEKALKYVITMNDEDKTQKTVDIKEYGFAFKKLSDEGDYTVYKVSMPMGFIEYDQSVEVHLETTNTDDGNTDYDSNVIVLNSECRIMGGSLVVSGSTDDENHYKTMGVGARESWIYLANAVVNKTTGDISYVPVQNVSDIKIERWSSRIVEGDTSVPTIEETDEEGVFKLTFDTNEDKIDGCYLVTVGKSKVLLEKSKEVTRLYKADYTSGDSATFTQEDNYELTDTLDTTTSGNTFYAYFRKSPMGALNKFHYLYVRNEETGEYYYFEDLLTDDKNDPCGDAENEDWDGETVTIADSASAPVTVTLTGNVGNDTGFEKKDWLFTITVSNDAPANLYLYVGMEVDATEGNIWTDGKELIVSTVAAEVEEGSDVIGENAVDGGKVTIASVPSIKKLGLEDSNLSDDDISSAKNVTVSLKTSLLNVDASFQITSQDEELLNAVKAIRGKKEDVLSDNYSAKFLDLSVSATVTKAESNESDAKVKVSVTETDSPFEIKIPIPDGMKEMKGFSILRYHKDKDGKELTDRLIPTVVYENNEPSYLTFKSDKFSTYALAYRSVTDLDKLDFSNVTWSSAESNVFAYDGTEKTVNLTVEGLPSGCTATLKGETTGTEAGSYRVYIDEITYDGKPYKASDAELPSAVTRGYGWTILGAGMSLDTEVASAITVTATSGSITAGDDFTPGYTVDGADNVTGLNVTYTITDASGNVVTDVKTASAGTYTITPTVTFTADAKVIYAVTPVPGTLTITEKPAETPTTPTTPTETPTTPTETPTTPTETPTTPTPTTPTPTTPDTTTTTTPTTDTTTTTTPTTDTTTTDTTKKDTTTTTVKKGTTTKKSGNTYTVTNAKTKTVAFTSVKKNSKTVTIPSSVKIDGVSYKVTSVAANAFKNNKKLTKVTIPSSVTKIGASAFSGCTKLATVTISKNVTSIGKSAFSGCTSLKKVTLPTKLTTIGASAFSGCKKLTSVTIPKNVKSIGKQAFYNCSKLSKVTIKSSKIKTIGSKAFSKTAKKTTITVPSKKKTAYKKLLKKAGYTKTVKAAK